MKASFQGNTLTVDGRAVTLPHAIEEILALSDRVIVLLDPEDYADDDLAMNHNLLAVGKNGEILWWVKRAHEFLEEDDGEKHFSAFTTIELAKDGKTLRTFEWDGVWHDLDPRAGQLSNALFTR